MSIEEPDSVAGFSQSHCHQLLHRVMTIDTPE